MRPLTAMWRGYGAVDGIPEHNLAFPFPLQKGKRPPPAVQAYLRTVCYEVEQLQGRVQTLEARFKADSTTSSRPPSSDSPYKKPRRHTTSTTPRQAGGKPGHP